ncbi:hypothetical protein EON80_26755 [bacterium]|nr:MAG: hypothetical protein EON80_26755 [bacterium]
MASEREITLPVTQPLITEKLTTASVKPVEPNAAAKCTQCGKSMRHMPLFLKNITCRDCYGMERYRPGNTTMPATHPALLAPAPDETVTV